MKTDRELPEYSQDAKKVLQDLLDRVVTRAVAVQRAVSGRMSRAGATSRSEGLNTAEILKRARDALQELALLDKELAQAEERWKQVTEQWWLEAESRLKDLCARREWRIDGSWPAYLVAYGVSVRFDEKTRMVFVSESKLSSADPEEIEQRLAEAVSTLVPSDFSPPRFLEDVFKAYEESRGSKRQIPLLDVYRSYVLRKQQGGFWRNAKRDKFVEVSMDRFRACLARMLEANVVKTASGKDLRLFPPLDAADGLYLYNPIDRRLGFIGRVEFTDGEELT